MSAAGTVLVTGGGGYVGSKLVPELLRLGYRVRVLDLFWYGKQVLQPVMDHPGLSLIEGDIRDQDRVDAAVAGVDTVIHLACISNDPSFELSPDLGRSINFDAFEPLVEASCRGGVIRFIYASSSSVYGISDAPDVSEDHPLRPLTDYSRFKAACEPLLLERKSASFCPVVIRPATLCGYAPRQRLDLTVNILTHHAMLLDKVTVFGGAQKRPNLHIDDMVGLYCQLLGLPAARVAGRIYNVGYENHTVSALAEQVRDIVSEAKSKTVTVETTPSNDQRSYHISSERIRKELGFVPRHSIGDAIRELVDAFRTNKLPNSLEDDRYYNVRRMQRLCVK